MLAGEYFPIFIDYEVMEERVIRDVIHDNSRIGMSFLPDASQKKISPRVAFVRVIVQKINLVHRT